MGWPRRARSDAKYAGRSAMALSLMPFRKQQLAGANFGGNAGMIALVWGKRASEAGGHGQKTATNYLYLPGEANG